MLINIQNEWEFSLRSAVPASLTVGMSRQVILGDIKGCAQGTSVSNAAARSDENLHQVYPFADAAASTTVLPLDGEARVVKGRNRGIPPRSRPKRGLKGP